MATSRQEIHGIYLGKLQAATLEGYKGSSPKAERGLSNATAALLKALLGNLSSPVIHPRGRVERRRDCTLLWLVLLRGSGIGKTCALHAGPAVV